MTRTAGMILAVAIAMAIAVPLWLQSETARGLRVAIAAHTGQAAEIARLRAMRQRLAAEQVSPVELAQLRADRAALAQLRSELADLKAGLERREAARAERATPVRQEVPVASFAIGVGLDGTLVLDGNPIDLEGMKGRLAPYAGGGLVEMRMKVPKGAEQVRRANEGMIALYRIAKELKLNYRGIAVLE